MTKEAFRFTSGSLVWRYTSARKSLTIGAETFAPKPIRRERWSHNIGNLSFDVTMPSDLVPATLFVQRNPATVVSVQVLDESGDVLFSGYIGTCTFKVSDRLAILKVVSAATIAKGQIPRRNYGAGCPFCLYDSDCGVDPAEYKLTFPVIEATITEEIVSHADIALQPNYYYTGGFIQIGDQRILVVAHENDTVTLLHSFGTLNANDVDLYPGCDKTRTSCLSKFGNLAHFGGFPFIPRKNPVTDGVL